eukprot:554977-Prymnesium_polylepis.1
MSLATPVVNAAGQATATAIVDFAAGVVEQAEDAERAAIALGTQMDPGSFGDRSSVKDIRPLLPVVVEGLQDLHDTVGASSWFQIIADAMQQLSGMRDYVFQNLRPAAQIGVAMRMALEQHRPAGSNPKPADMGARADFGLATPVAMSAPPAAGGGPRVSQPLLSSELFPRRSSSGTQPPPAGSPGEAPLLARQAKLLAEQQAVEQQLLERQRRRLPQGLTGGAAPAGAAMPAAGGGYFGASGLQ